MTAKQAEKIITKDGWYYIGAEGSHHHYLHPTKKGKVTISFHHGDIPKKSLSSIMRQAGLK
ncbi:MAG: type II toxin-antitoxin system HicA family toxin [Ruminococcus sp.]|jgi:predicted RNA binding protein YcfA (HicA-like mRNA interferase family)|nr:type II toxin-antitoxin system HicA family toxin [Ruminococcus sp.]